MRENVSFFKKAVALYLIVSMLGNAFLPSVAYALTGGPDSPEFSSFTPVTSSDMVNLFTGDFNYNLPLIDVPGPHGSGYSLALSYNSGVSPEQESSWVGFGWSLNPGSITRNLRGIPDDFKAKEIKYFYKQRPTWTATSGTNVNLETFSSDNLPIGSIGAQFIHRLNNYTGYQKVTSLGLNAFGMVGVNATFDPNGVTYAPYVSPMGILSRSGIFFDTKNIEKEYSTAASNKNRIESTTKLKAIASQLKGTSGQSGNISASLYNISSVQDVQKPFQLPSYRGFAINWSASLQGNFAGSVPVGIQGGKSGKFDFRYNKYRESKLTYGYIHTHENSQDGLYDYFVEKDNPYSRQDVFLGIPHSNYDMFTVTGEGVIGGFRAYPYQAGHFTPKNNKGVTELAQVGFEAMIGTNVGAGIDIGYGYNETGTDAWSRKDNEDNQITDSDVFYRFNNDAGGEVNYKYKHFPEDNYIVDTELNSAQVITYGSDLNKNCQYESGSYSCGDGTVEINGKTSYIEPNHNGSSLIEGYNIVNENGVTYAYEQPVMVKNQTSLSIDVDASADLINNRFLTFKTLGLGKAGNGQYDINNDVLYSKQHRVLQGEINPHSYAKSFLLTSILTPDFVEADGINGPSQGDYGGWTSFDYRKVYGNSSINNKWYRFRTPYNGLAYQQNSISNPKDDIASIQTGEKEVLYLKAIKTKTHVACFVTNKTSQSDFSELLNGAEQKLLDGTYAQSGSDDHLRKDGLGALDLDFDPLTGKAFDPASEVVDDEKRHNKEADIEFLEKIVLFPLDAKGHVIVKKPVKVVKFEYDYSLVPNVTNNINSSYNYTDNNNVANDNSGKLTLRKVWTEYNGVVQAKISPYIFDYNYPKFSDGRLFDLFVEYNDLNEQGENPIYSPYALGPWGNMMPNGVERRKNGVPWIDQSAFLEQNEFDPAAYHLKSIQLPSGSKIYVQYESDDYAYVQDRNAMAMARIVDSVVESVSGVNPKYDETPKYYVDVKDLGVDDTDSEQVDELVQKINRHFGKPLDSEPVTFEYDKKIYYKFLFSLLGNNKATLDNFRSEYITGYADIESVEKELKPGTTDQYCIKITLAGQSGNERAIVPQQACYEFVTNQRQGKVENIDGIEGMERTYDNRLADAADESADPNGSKGKKTGVALEMLAGMALGVNFTKYGNLKKKEVAQSFNEELSFIKLPVLNRKIGGGVRVKRILLHDTGIEEGDQLILGTNYHYTLEDGVTSSGVATNEPASAREENPLVAFMPNKEQEWYKKMINGENKDQTEGPIGESILPGASIGYSRVVVENIHTGKSGNGYNIHEYYTAKDYPYDKYYQHINENDYDFKSAKAADMTGIAQEDFNLGINAGLFGYNIDRVWMSQGYRFIQNNMHGQLKKSTTFSGSYVINSPGFLVSYQSYDFYDPGEKVDMVKLNTEGSNLITTAKVPGKEMDITREVRRIKDTNYDLNVEIDISVGVMFLPPIFVGVVPTFNYRENTIATHVTTKVINYPAIMKKQTSYIDGISSTTEFVAFDEMTGKPVLTRVKDSYDGVLQGSSQQSVYQGDIYSLNIPANWIPQYATMGQKSRNAEYTNQLTSMAGTYTVYNTNPIENTDWYTNPVNVINASIQTYKGKSADDDSGSNNDWNNKALLSYYDQPDGFQKVQELNSNWKPDATYTYHEKLKDGIYVYEKGKYDIAEPYSFADSPDANIANNWLRLNQTVLYSPDGQVLEEKDALGISSAVVYGKYYGGNVPIIIGKNADYGSLLFRDFENETSAQIMTNPHSGSRAALVSNITNVLEGVIATDELQKQGGLFKAWLKTEANDLELSVTGITNNIPLARVAQSGEWYLFEGLLPTSGELQTLATTNEPLQANLVSQNGLGLEDMIDDIRFQPLNTSATCYVYDQEDLKLLTQFDDQHFGMYYQYNMEGQLVRQIVETERGKFTIKEVNYNIPKQLRTAK